MKKNSQIAVRATRLLLAAFFLSVVSSCNKTEPTSPDPGGDDPEPVPAGVFRTKSETIEATKIWLDLPNATSEVPFPMVWNTADRINVYNDFDGTSSLKNVYRPSQESSNPDLILESGSIDNETGNYYAVFPETNSSFSKGIFTVSIPATQSIRYRTIKGSGTTKMPDFHYKALPVVAHCGAGRVMHFQYAGAGLKITPTTSVPEWQDFIVKKLVIYSGWTDQYIAGNVKVQMNDDGGITNMSVSSSGNSSITVYYENTGSSASPNYQTHTLGEGVPFYVAVMPMVLDPAKTTFTFTLNDGSADFDVVVYPGGRVNVKRGQIYDITIEPVIPLEKVEPLTGNRKTAAETSNCYVVNAPGLYRFPVDVRGNGQGTTATSRSTTTISGTASAELYYWNNLNGSTFTQWSAAGTKPDWIGSEGFSAHTYGGKAYVYFRILRDKDSHSGNCLVVTKNGSGTKLWVWQIWKQSGLAEVAVTTSYGSSVFLNMNVGANQADYSATACNGLMYQWGRHNPFPGGEATTGELPSAFSYQTASASYNSTIPLPDRFFASTMARWCSDDNVYDSWNTSAKTTQSKGNKTMEDPCPAGYMVMSDFDARVLFASTAKTYYDNYAELEGVKFPYCGRWCSNPPAISQYGTKAYYHCSWSKNPSSGTKPTDWGAYGYWYNETWQTSKSENWGTTYRKVDISGTQTTVYGFFDRANGTPIRCTKLN